MNVKLFAIGLTGAIPPLLALALGLTSPLVLIVAWTALAALVWVPLVVRAKAPRPFLTLLGVGVVAGVAAGIVDALTTGDPMLFGMALVIGTVWGALFGAVALGWNRMRATA